MFVLSPWVSADIPVFSFIIQLIRATRWYLSSVFVTKYTKLLTGVLSFPPLSHTAMEEGPLPNATCPLNPTLLHLLKDLFLFNHEQLGFCVLPYQKLSQESHLWPPYCYIPKILFSPYTTCPSSSLWHNRILLHFSKYYLFSIGFFDNCILFIFLLLLGPSLLVFSSSFSSQMLFSQSIYAPGNFIPFNYHLAVEDSWVLTSILWSLTSSCDSVSWARMPRFEAQLCHFACPWLNSLRAVSSSIKWGYKQYLLLLYRLVVKSNELIFVGGDCVSLVCYFCSIKGSASKEVFNKPLLIH